MLHRTLRRTTKLLVYSVFGVTGYSLANKNPYDQFKKPEIKQVISREPYRVQIFLHLPLNSLSRLWGRMSRVEVPTFCREFLYTAYIKAYNCDVTEAENEDLRSYKCFGDFFTRSLKKDLRPVSEHAPLVSPSDGVILNMGRVETCQVTHVKDKDYNLQYFIGPKTWNLAAVGGGMSESVNDTGLVGRFYGLFSGWFSAEKSEKIAVSNQDGFHVSSPSSSSSSPSSSSSSHPPLQSTNDNYPNCLKTHPSNHLYHCTIYLAPGDYHRFHSPADWKCTFRRHFPGYLLSVSPHMADRMPELMNVNERVVYVGGWKHGFLSMVLVGATNVGSIRVYSDPLLVTNKRANLPTMIDTHFSDNDPKSISPSSPPPLLPQITPPSSSPSFIPPQPTTPAFLRKMVFRRGEPFGQFNLGSTIVLVFEAPADFKFTHKIGEKLKFGQAL